MFQLFSCSSECKHRKCRHTVLLIGGLNPLISFTAHSSKRHIFSFPFDLVVNLRKLIHELLIKHLTTFLGKKQNSQILSLVNSYFIFSTTFVGRSTGPVSSFMVTNNDCPHVIPAPKVLRAMA